jgi:tetratricopeptide (TPR) repeat protein
MKPLLCLLLGLALFTSSPPTFAQTPKNEVPYADKEKAKSLAKEAVTAFTEKAYEKALKAFQDAYALNPDFKYLPPIAQCSFLLGRYEETVVVASQYLKEAEPDNPKRTEVEKLLLDARAALDKQKQDKMSETKTKAETAFSEANYEKALALFQEVYATTPNPDLLYKMALCHSKLKHNQEAIKAFEAFLQSTTPDDPLRGSAEKQVTALKEEAAKAVDPAAAEQKRAEAEALQAKAKQEAVDKVEPSVGRSSGKKLLIVAGVSGGLSIAPGVVAALSAKKLNELTAVTSRLEVNAAEIAKFEARRKRTALASDVMLGVALAVGGVGIVINAKSKKAEKSVGLSVTPTGAAFSVHY